MKYAKIFGLLALAAGMASAADYGRVDRMRAEIARDRARVNEEIRCERRAPASRDAQYRDVRRDYRGRDWR
jgi:hypothetical protein